jgi:hypothetical protein
MGLHQARDPQVLVIDHVVIHPESGTAIIEVLRPQVSLFHLCTCLIISLQFAFVGAPGLGVFQGKMHQGLPHGPLLGQIEGGSQVKARLYGLQGSPQEWHSYVPYGRRT